MFLLSIKMITCYFLALTIINIPLFIAFYSNSSQFSGLQDYLSGLSIALIVIGCILALVLLYFMITYKPTPTNFAEIARYQKEMYGFN
jgi:hypothetical protein